MTRMPRRWAPRPAAVGASAWRRGAAAGGMAGMLALAPLVVHPLAPIPPPAHLAASGLSARSASREALSRIILPDLVVIEPHGLSPATVARIGKLPHVRTALGLDGASVTVAGRTMNVIGVNAGRFRPWTPLRTASDQRLWTSLASGGFAASPGARRALRLRRGASYRLGEAYSARLTFAGTAKWGIGGVDLVVPGEVSASLGLIPNVATLISAPGVRMSTLEREVRSVLGRTASLIRLRGRQRPSGPAAAGRPRTYLQLFRESAARYCPGLPWTVLAAIGQIESGDGANNGPSIAGALGPMQFLPSTWRTWGIAAFGEPGPPNIMDPYDAVPSAARYLCAAGAARPGGLSRAIFAYNHATWYVREVLALAQQYARAYG